ncbi:OLC1v1031943C1 [Oldenlandia corymbosa var. corymbosa]|uniref:OLC1v1031943C1 n=1 Tax=Oldenlandia corymbosa var. corymbosa TaxID=529605 RepID=A0AAV1CJS2_OLDCO|nr:OLC1v1031943C1 [Oldenlandia corymbosa var. corymbosa]
MYSWEHKSSLSREEKSRKNHHQHNHPKNPSFSSTLLDEIYRSIDGNDTLQDHYHHKQQDLKLVYTERSTISSKKHGKKAAAAKAAGGGAAVEDEDMASLRKASLIEKWMEKEVHHKVSSRKTHNYNPPPLPPSTLFLHQDDDPLFFSSTSSSSESSNSGGLSSSSDTEFYAASVKTSKSCFATMKKPKPVKTKQQQNESSKSSDHKKTEDQNLIKSQSRALKIYSNLKKVKDPISPGGRLTAFINNLFTNSKKHGNNNNAINVPSIPERKSTKYYRGNNVVSPPPSSTFSSACSTASSFSRSCLSKDSPNSRAAKRYNDGIKRTVRFYPVSVIVDEDSRPCGHKQIHDVRDNNNSGKPPLVRPPTTLSSQNESEEILNIKGFEEQKNEKNLGIQAEEIWEEDFDFDDEDDDAASDCSSDLFEIDHLALFGKGRFREELPVYETTHLDTNRAIASGLIR